MTKPKPRPTPDLVEIRRRLLTAVAADDLLVDLLVLKGGNALELIHRIGERASLDLDFSMEADVADTQDLEGRLKRSVEDRLDSIGLVVFDWTFGPRPQTPSERSGRWGGYRAEFKLVPLDLFRELGGDLSAMRRRSIELTGSHQRIFKIDISKYEFCRGYATANVDSYDLHVYTPAMIAAEKLRAVCQQMPEYVQRRNPAPRPRDFYDIHAVVTHAGVRLQDERELAWQMFAAKDVPWAFLGLIGRDRDRAFHRQGWAAVVESVRGELRDFDFYFDFVAAEATRLHALGEV